MAAPTLADLVARAKAKVEAQAKAKEATRVARTSRDPKVIAAARLASFEADWLPAALVFKAEIWTCLCGGSGQTPLGLFVLHEHARLATSATVLKSVAECEPPPHLPKRYSLDERSVVVCPECALTRGFARRYIPPKSFEVGPHAVPASFVGDFGREWAALTAPSPSPQKEAP